MGQLRSLWWVSITGIISLDKISGKIRDANTNEPIAGVKVLVAKGVFVLTDVDGLFELTIPGEHQRRELPLTLSKDGYQIADITATPETGAPVNFQMKRK